MWHRAVWGLILAGAVLLGAGCQSSPDAPRSQEVSGREPPAGPSSSAADQRPDSGSVAPSADTSAPEGMVLVPGGSTKIGITKRRWERLRQRQAEGPRPLFGKDASPPFWADIAAFYLDEHPVTVAQFRAFVDETGYTTQAEDFGNAGLLRGGRWQLIEGATWRHPRGPDQSAAPDDHPVTQVSWNDAEAYCEWTGKRLPTEVEWEHAAREGQNDRALCPWDGSCRDRSTRIENANTWQGQYPVRNTAADGFRYTSPVGAFGETDLGLQDMSGNVWEWTASWKRPYAARGTGFEPTDQSQRVQRGGSFICRECRGYFVFARSGSTPETSLFHVGFRCAKDRPNS